MRKSSDQLAPLGNYRQTGKENSCQKIPTKKRSQNWQQITKKKVGNIKISVLRTLADHHTDTSPIPPSVVVVLVFPADVVGVDGVSCCSAPSPSLLKLAAGAVGGLLRARERTEAEREGAEAVVVTVVVVVGVGVDVGVLSVEEERGAEEERGRVGAGGVGMSVLVVRCTVGVVDVRGPAIGLCRFFSTINSVRSPSPLTPVPGAVPEDAGMEIVSIFRLVSWNGSTILCMRANQKEKSGVQEEK